MADDVGLELLRLLRSSVMTLLSDALDVLADELPILQPVGPDWAGSGLENRLLEAPPATAAANPVTSRVLDALRNLSSIAGPDVTAGLFGWEPGPAGGAAGRGIACAVRRRPAVGASFAVAVAMTIDSAGSPQLDVVATGRVDGSAVFPLDGGWALAAAADVDDVVEVRLPLTGPAAVVVGSAGDVVRIGLARPAPVGQASGTGIDLGALELFAQLSLTASRPDLRGGMRISGGSVRIAPGDLSAIVPALGPIPLDVALALSGSRGVDLAGSPTLEVRLPTGASLPALSTGPLDLALVPQPDTPSVVVGVSCPVSLDLPAVPIRLDLEGLGFDVPFRLGGPSLAFDVAQLRLRDPAGAGVELELPMVTGAGRMQRSGPGYAGMLAVLVPPMSVSALGLLDPDTGSLLVILGSVFPPPGVQIGFGFAVTGVGGIVGVGRRVDRDALMQAVQDGTAAAMLMPADRAAGAQEVLPALDRAFPQAPGFVVVGPMFQVSWGGELIRATVAVLLELPDPARISVLGKVVMVAPNPVLPQVRLQATFVGQIDPAVPSMWFLASLTDSTIAGVPVSGDVYMLVRGGPRPDLVLSAGGFRPRYVRPAGVPALDRITVTLASGPLQLRCQAYLAITSNTIQFGARVDLIAEIAKCGLRGHLGFDVLVQLEPFRFVADVTAAVALRVFGETLLGVALAFSLEGPAPWRARGRGSIDLFLFSVPFDFDHSWGSPPPPGLVETPDIAGILREAFTRPEAWVAGMPDLAASPVQLSAAGRRRLEAATALHPHGSLSARQRMVPLGVTIDRYNRLPIAPGKWDVDRPVLGGDPLLTVGEEREQFAPALYVSMTGDGELSRPAFEQFRAGVRFVGGGVVVDAGRDVLLDYETTVISSVATASVPPDLDVGPLLDSSEAVAAAGFDDPRWWPVDEVVTVAEEPTFVTVDVWSSLTPAADVATAPPTASAQHEAAAAMLADDPARHLRVVEEWELLP